jgi:hypothetical protein
MFGMLLPQLPVILDDSPIFGVVNTSMLATDFLV